MRRTLAACCAREVTDQVAAVPGRSVMKSRRCISAPISGERDLSHSNECFDRGQNRQQDHCCSAWPVSQMGQRAANLNPSTCFPLHLKKATSVSYDASTTAGAKSQYSSQIFFEN